MPCKCKQKQQQPVTVMSGGYESLTIYKIAQSTDPLEQSQTVTTSSPTPFIVQRGNKKQTFAVNQFFGLKQSEISQLLEQGAPIYVYG
mgnify:CR=1 FL=1